MMLVLVNDDILTGGLGLDDLHPLEIKSIDKFWDLLRKGKILGLITEKTLDNIDSKLIDNQNDPSETIKDIRAVLDVLPVDLAIEEEMELVDCPNEDIALKLAYASFNNLDAIVVQNSLSFPYKTEIDVFTVEKVVQFIELENLFSLSSIINLEEELPINNLTNWFEGQFNSYWHSVEEVLIIQPRRKDGVTSIEQRSERDPIRRCKLIKLGTKSIQLLVGLVIKLTAKSVDELEVLIQIHPIFPHTNLVRGIKLILLDDCDNTLDEVISRDIDNFIEFSIEGEHEDCFSVRVDFEEFSITEKFVV